MLTNNNGIKNLVNSKKYVRHVPAAHRFSTTDGIPAPY